MALVLIYIVNNDGSDELHEDAYLFAHSLPVVTAYESQLKILQSDAFQSSNSRLAQFYRMNNLDYEPAIKGASLAAPVEAGQHKYQKQAKDYLFALDACSLLSPHHEINYTLILEDDTYADDEYLPKIMSAVGRLKGKKWGLLKLWFTEHFMGWSTFDVPILIFFGFLGLTAAKYVAKFNAKVDSDKLANYVGVFSGLLFLLILVIIGKQVSIISYYHYIYLRCPESITAFSRGIAGDRRRVLQPSSSVSHFNYRRPFEICPC